MTESEKRAEEFLTGKRYGDIVRDIKGKIEVQKTFSDIQEIDKIEEFKNAVVEKFPYTRSKTDKGISNWENLIRKVDPEVYAKEELDEIEEIKVPTRRIILKQKVDKSRLSKEGKKEIEEKIDNYTGDEVGNEEQFENLINEEEAREEEAERVKKEAEERRIEREKEISREVRRQEKERLRREEEKYWREREKEIEVRRQERKIAEAIARGEEVKI